MIALLRRLIIITSLFGIILFIQSIQVEAPAVINPKTLAVLGFAILASFTLGEILALVKLPRVIGYLLIGIVFGPQSSFIIGNNLLKVFNTDVLHNLNLVNSVTLSVIAVTAGMELKLDGLKKSAKSISMILLFKIVFMFVLVTGLVYVMSPYILFLSNAGTGVIIAAGLILSVVALGTSIELTLVVAEESKAKGRFIDVVLSTAIVKDVVVILLLAIVLAISAALISPAGAIDISVFLDLGRELLFSVLLGGVIGVIAILYLKYISRELLLFILSLVVFGSELSSLFHLETLIVFVTAGFAIQNFSEFGEKFHSPLQKLALPIFIIFFTVAGASINFISIQDTILIGLAIVVVRAIALYFSVRTAGKLSKESSEVTNYGWLGFLSIGGLILGLAIVIANKLPGLGDDLKNIITSIVAVNIFLGPILLKVGIGKAAKSVPEKVDAGEPEGSSQPEMAKEVQKLKELKAKFNEPDFNNEQLNKSLFNILFKMNNILSNFNRRFIHFRTEESLELIIEVTERYSDQYAELRKSLTDPKITPAGIKKNILDAEKNLSQWFVSLCDQRKDAEKNIMSLEPLIKDLFFSLTDLTDGMPNEFIVDLEKEKTEINPNDKFIIKFRKYLKQADLFVHRLFDKNYKLTRTIHYKNLAKYYLVGESANEILEAVNLVGAERLTTLKKVKSLYNNIISYLSELITLADEEKENIAAAQIVIARFDELHNQFLNEIKIYTVDVNRTGDEISERLTYAVANPFNELLRVLKVAGTYESQEGKIRYSKIFAKSEESKELALQTIRFWINYYIGFNGSLAKEAYINSLKVSLSETVMDSLVNISDEINKSLRSVSSKLIGKINEFKKTVESFKDKDGDKFYSYLCDSKEAVFLNTLNQYKDKLDEIKRSGKLNWSIENLIKEFSALSSQLPEKLYLLEEKDLALKDRLPNFKELKFVKLQEIAKSLLEKKFPREIGEITELLFNHLNITLLELKNFYSIINFHINAAAKEVQNGNSDLGFELVGSLCDKLQERLSQLNTQIDRLELNINNKIVEKVDLVIGQINELILDSSTRSANLFLKKEKQKDVITGKVKNVAAGFGYEIKKVFVIGKKIYRKYLENIIDDLLVRINFKKPAASGAVTDVIQINEDKLKQLPFIYRKLFDGTPLESTDYFIGKDELLEKVRTALKNFNENKNSATVIIGEPGSGKRSLLNTIYNNALRDESFVPYTFERTITKKEELLEIFTQILEYDRTFTFDELVSVLNDRSKKRIIILENINKLFFRKVNGFDALKMFIYLLSETNKNTFWICSMGKFSWNFINSNFDLSNVFSLKVQTEEMHKHDIRSIVLNRHNATGFNLQFLPDEIQQIKKKLFGSYGKEDEQKALEKLFFDRLEEYSEGNIISAMFYWLQSIESVKNNTIFIKPPRRVVLSVLANLDTIYLLTLSNILIHGWLTDTEHSELFGIPVEKSRRILNYLASLNIIYLDQIEINSNKYFINKFVFKAIEKELTKRNIF